MEVTVDTSVRSTGRLGALGNIDVSGGSLVKSLALLLIGGGAVVEDLDHLNRVSSTGADGFGTAVEEVLHGAGFVYSGVLSVEASVSKLEGHLASSIRGHLHELDTVTSVILEVKHRGVNIGSKLRVGLKSLGKVSLVLLAEVPLKLLEGSCKVLSGSTEGLDVCGRGLSAVHVSPNLRDHAVPGEAVSESVVEVHAEGAVVSADDVVLIEPAVASVASVKEVVRAVRNGCRDISILENHSEHGVVDKTEGLGVLFRRLDNALAGLGPEVTLAASQHANVLVDATGVGISVLLDLLEDRLEGLCGDGLTLLIHDLNAVDVVVTECQDVLALEVGLKLVAANARDTGGAEDEAHTVHAEGLVALHVGLDLVVGNLVPPAKEARCETSGAAEGHHVFRVLLRRECVERVGANHDLKAASKVHIIPELLNVAVRVPGGLVDLLEIILKSCGVLGLELFCELLGVFVLLIGGNGAHGLQIPLEGILHLGKREGGNVEVVGVIELLDLVLELGNFGRLAA
mmetsp:Transcript_17315/g.34010  ORF Transcript_17315/g.34010 Transcript_17315/m.34010 type:complete len:515 (-) Transcript_17315:248-1792(-)